ncbi:MAG: hypothetical protein Q8Q25_01035 [bacterium]|nr:hypothetical protein [bacterium]
MFEKSHLTDKNNLGKLFFQGDTNPSLTPNPDLVESIITISPERTIVGAYFDYHQDFCCRCSFWLDVKMAFYQATHNLHAEECDLGLESSCTPLSFLSSDLLQFGRIPITKLKEFNVDDIEVKLGHNFYNKGGYVGVYGSALLPIAPKPTAEFLFEPLVGRGHWGLGIGINAAHTFCRSETKSLTFLADFSYQYLFNRNELRSLDFKTGQLTRFIVLNTEVGTDPIAAINVTTLNLGVTPRGIINFWLASHLQYCQCHVELGYNLWWRQSEKICYPTCLQTNFDSLGVIDSTDTFTPLTLDSLDLASAASSSTLTNKLYIAFSCDANMCLSPNIGLGASYEISKNINSIGQWGVWLNIGLNL